MSAASPAAHARPSAAPESGSSGGRRPPLGRILAALLLPISMAPVVLLAPSLVRAPAVLVRHAAHALAPAHHTTRHRLPPQGPSYYLVGPARLEIEAMEGSAGALTPKVGVSPLDEPAWAAAAAAQSDAPSVLVARGRETTDASGLPLHGAADAPRRRTSATEAARSPKKGADGPAARRPTASGGRRR